MNKTIFPLFIIAILLACGSPADPADSATASSNKLDGKSIYKNYCIACHGYYGDMGGSGAFDLTKSKLSLEERIKVIAEGRKLMTPFNGMLSEEKIKAVAKYVESLRTK